MPIAISATPPAKWLASAMCSVRSCRDCSQKCTNAAARPNTAHMPTYPAKKGSLFGARSPAGTAPGSIITAIIATHIAATTLGCDTAGLGQVLLPVRRVEPVVAHILPGRGSVDESPVAEIDADVRALLAFEV